MSANDATRGKTGYDRLRPLLFRLDPEVAHSLTLRLLRLFGAYPLGHEILRRLFPPMEPISPISVLGLQFRNPLGLAAGYDKDGIAYLGLARLGFGHLELGTVTLEPQAGRETPRIFRLVDDNALINRMGFPNRGAVALLRRLERRKRSSTVIGVNIGKGADSPIEEAADEYAALVKVFHPVADYISINVSSPNTLGLRKLQSREYLQHLLGKVREARTALQVQSSRHVPILVKISPDLSDIELEDAIHGIIASGLDGVIATNTTVRRGHLRSKDQHEGGGLSGKPLFERTRAIVGKIHSMTSGNLAIIAGGGIFTGEDAQRMIDSGASLVQIFTGLVYHGPAIITRILGKLESNSARPNLIGTPDG